MKKPIKTYKGPIAKTGKKIRRRRVYVRRRRNVSLDAIILGALIERFKWHDVKLEDQFDVLAIRKAVKRIADNNKLWDEISVIARAATRLKEIKEKM